MGCWRVTYSHEIHPSAPLLASTNPRQQWRELDCLKTNQGQDRSGYVIVNFLRVHGSLPIHPPIPQRLEDPPRYLQDPGCRSNPMVKLKRLLHLLIRFFENLECAVHEMSETSMVMNQWNIIKLTGTWGDLVFDSADMAWVWTYPKVHPPSNPVHSQESSGEKDIHFLVAATVPLCPTDQPMSSWKSVWKLRGCPCFEHEQNMWNQHLQDQSFLCMKTKCQKLSNVVKLLQPLTPYWVGQLAA